MPSIGSNPSLHTDSVEDRRNRMLQHAIHEETVYYNRLNFFAVIETVLIAAFASIATAPNQELLRQILTGIGFVTAILWSFAQIRSHLYVNQLGARLRMELPEFRERPVDKHRNVVATARALMAWTLPVAFAGGWLLLLS